MILVNNTKLNTTIFPNGEQKVKQPWINKNYNQIVLKWESDQDFINLMFVKHYLDDQSAKEVSLHIPYFPYSRMDRKIKNDLFTLKSLCKFINHLNFESVTICEPHSDVTPALLDRCIVQNITMDLFLQFEKTIKPDYVFYPDAGAQKRYHTNRYPNLVGHKIRNSETGQIESFKVVSDVNSFANKPTIVILDDLSSYGGTFLHSAKALKTMGAGDIYLIVAHAEKNIFKGEIFSSALFKKVLTTNSILDIKDANSELHIENIF